jgi:hypothetical protein
MKPHIKWAEREGLRDPLAKVPSVQYWSQPPVTKFNIARKIKTNC